MEETKIQKLIEGTVTKDLGYVDLTKTYTKIIEGKSIKINGFKYSINTLITKTSNDLEIRKYFK